MLTSEINLRISQEIGSSINGMNTQIENAISSAISEMIIPQMQGVKEAVLKNRQLGSVDENNIQNRNSRSRINVTEPEDESPYSCGCCIFRN